MTVLRIAGAGLALMMMTMAYTPSIAESAAPPKTIAQVAVPKLAESPASQRISAFLPSNFNAPTLVQTAGFKLVPLGPELAKIDYDAYMSSIEHLQKTFTRSMDWPRKNISSADAMLDMENEQARFKNRKSFAYAVLTPDGSRERGSVYVSPSTDKSYDAVVKMWVTKDEHDAGFDAELYKWVIKWMQTDWPFKKVAYPGRSIAWETWDSMVGANTPEKVVPGG